MDAWNNYCKISRWILTGFFCLFIARIISDILILFVLPLEDYHARLTQTEPFQIIFLVAFLASAALSKLLQYHYLGSLANLRAEKGHIFRITTHADMLELVKSDSPQFKNGPSPDARGLIYRRSLKMYIVLSGVFFAYNIFFTTILLALCRSKFG